MCIFSISGCAAICFPKFLCDLVYYQKHILVPVAPKPFLIAFKVPGWTTVVFAFLVFNLRLLHLFRK